MKKPAVYAIYLSCFVVGAAVHAQDHGHLNVGALSPTPGAKLVFDNGGDFSIESEFVKTLTFTNSGRFANLYQGNITLTALHSTNAFGDPAPGAAAPGSFVVAEILSVDGPKGGVFQFWETNSATSPAVSIPTGTREAGFRFELSESRLGAGQPGGDPFGHIHGRRFTTTLPGIYTVGFRALDLSTNGPGGGPIHSASDVLYVYFQADVHFLRIQPHDQHVHVTFGAQSGYVWQVQAKDSLAETQWRSIGDPIPGDDSFHEVEDQQPSAHSRVYRVVGTAAGQVQAAAVLPVVPGGPETR